MLTVAVLAIGYTSWAGAVVLTLDSVAGTWSSLTGGSSIVGLGTNQVNWGNPAPNGAGLRFDGAAPPTTPINTDTAFALGTLTHINTPTFGSSASAAILTLAMTVTDGSTVNMNFGLGFAIQETSNSTPCPSFQVSSTPCDDRITFPSALSSASFVIDGTSFNLLLLGFGSSATSLQSGFITEERISNTTTLWAELDSNGAVGVPEPGTALLLGAALLGIGSRRRKQSDQV